MKTLGAVTVVIVYAIWAASSPFTGFQAKSKLIQTL